MTQNQLKFFQLQEDKRHNVEAESVARAQLAESNRHNVVLEDETKRNNQAQEAIQQQANVINSNHYSRMDAEASRHNLATESIQKQQADTQAKQATEAARHNVAVEKEAKRHNTETESVSRYTMVSDRIKANASETSADASVITANAKMKDAMTNEAKAEASRISAISNVTYQNNAIANQFRQNQIQSFNALVNQQNLDRYYLLDSIKTGTQGFKDVTAGLGNVVSPLMRVWSK